MVQKGNTEPKTIGVLYIMQLQQENLMEKDLLLCVINDVGIHWTLLVLKYHYKTCKLQEVKNRGNIFLY